MDFEKVRAIIAKQLDIDPETITPSSNLIDDLHADSLDIVEMIMDLESELGIELDLEDQKITTFRELADFIESKLN